MNLQSPMFGIAGTLALLVALCPATTRAQSSDVDRYSVPPTVSPQAAARLTRLYAIMARSPKRERPQTQEDWDKANAPLLAMAGPVSKATADSLHVTTTEETLGGVQVVRLRPAGYKRNGQLILYLHGGAYTFFSAQTTLTIPALIASSGGDEVVSIDYTLAPRGNWHTATDQVLAVWKAVLASGVKAESVGLMGDSAGAGLAAGSVLKMRDEHQPLPGALYLMSPSTDLSVLGDTATTLAAADPILKEETTRWSLDAYAAPADQKNPYVSPVYGDYSKAFPPTLIQGGTRELLLSSAVREYQAIRAGGHEAILDIYEGMPHDFQQLIPKAPETATAIKRASEFFSAHLRP